MKTELGRTVADMLQNCMPKEMIVLAVDMYVLALESTRHQVDETAEKRRAWDREYRRKQRGHPPDTPDIHPTSADKIPSILREDKKLSEVEVKKERKKERGTKIPPDWTPNESHYAEGLRRGMDRAGVDEKAKDMRIWCASNSNRAVTTKSNWDQAFMGWLRREPVRFNGHAVSNNRTDPAAGRATAREADQIAAMGRGAANRLASRNATGPDDGAASGGASSAEVFDIRKRAESAY